MQCRLWLWLGLLFIVSTTTVKSAVVSAATEKHQVRYVWIQTSQTDSIDCEWFYNGCASSYAICFAVQRFKSNLSAMGTCSCSEFGEIYEAAGNLWNHSRWCSMMFYKFYISTMFRLWDLWKKTIFGRKMWFTSGFHCADIAGKLVFPSKLLFYMPDHQEFPAFCTRFFRGCSCHVGSTDESRRTFLHPTRVPMKELRGRTSPVWHWEGAALGTGNLDMSSDHGGGWWLALAGSWYNIGLDSITGYRRWFATTEALPLPPATVWEASACQIRHGKNRH